jgi:6-pyruvoyl-tetrahydropterin synthase
MFWRISLRHTTTAHVTFEASHFVMDHSLCGRTHGHQWNVAVTVEGGLDPRKIWVVEHGELLSSLNRIVREFADRDLNDMLPGVVTTPEGLALYVRERMTLEWPRIVRIEVEMGPSIVIALEPEIR